MSGTRPNFEEAKSRVACKDHAVEIRRRINRGGAVSWVEQCRVCGERFNTLKAKDVPDYEKVLPVDYDEAMNAGFHTRINDELRKMEDASRETERSEWWNWYNAYLFSPEWQKIRAKVLKRANGVCEGCLEAPAVLAHHKTYERAGNEMGFDLVALCQACHDVIHQKAGLLP